MHYPVMFAPIAQKRIWGGEKLKEWFSEQKEGPIGEYWVLSGHPVATSIVINGKYAGKTLVELTKEFPEAYLGASSQERFPLLIKFLEATDDLSVQIHPADEYANQNESDYGKTECWYILDCKKEGNIIYGHSFNNHQQYLTAVQEKKVKDYLRYLPIKNGQLIFVPSQTLHALMAGTILIEIQQTSDITYRVYDWDRVDENGQSRELHVDKAADVMRYGEPESFVDVTGSRNTLVENDQMKHEHLLSCPYFTIEKLMLEGSNYTLKLGRSGNPDILIVAAGEGTLDSGQGMELLSMKRGDTILIPSTISYYNVQTDSQLVLLKVNY